MSETRRRNRLVGLRVDDREQRMLTATALYLGIPNAEVLRRGMYEQFAKVAAESGRAADTEGTKP